MFPHLPVDDPVDETVVGNKSEYSFPVLLNQMLPEPDEFDVVVRQRLDISFVQVFLLIRNQFLDPGRFIAAAYRIRRISQYHHDRCIPFNMVRLIGLLG